MKFRITERQNLLSGEPIHYIYKSVDGSSWTLVDGTTKLEDARKMVERLLSPVAEKVIEEFEG
jgi:hypothetical protein